MNNFGLELIFIIVPYLNWRTLKIELLQSLNVVNGVKNTGGKQLFGNGHLNYCEQFIN